MIAQYAWPQVYSAVPSVTQDDATVTPVMTNDGMAASL